MHKLTALKLKSLPSGKHEDGGGLRIVMKSDGHGKWVFRYTCNGSRREMGLGPYPNVSLKDARELAAEARSLVARGTDPIVERNRVRDEQRRNRRLFKDVADEAFECLKPTLKGEGTNGRWMSPLALHVLPKLGDKPVDKITQIDIRDTLAPIWNAKADTARKAMNRLGLVLKHAAALGLDVDLQATVKAKALLGAQSHKPKHVPSMPWQEVPNFYAGLGDGTPAQLALRLLILTGARSTPIRLARLEEFEDGVWTIPAANMKALEGKARDFRVPLSEEARRVVAQALPMARNGYLFPGTGKGMVIGDMTMSALMKRQGREARPHGFRASLRTWLAEATGAPHEVAEAVLAHVSDSAVVRAYRRTDFLEQRRPLMEEWAVHCTGKHKS